MSMSRRSGRLFRRLTVVLLAASLAACSTVRPVPLGQAEKPSLYGRPDDLHLGDKVTVTTVDGRSLEMQITELHPGTVEGLPSGQTERVQLRDADIQSMERTEISGAKTFGLVAGIFVVVVVIPALLLVRAVAKAV